MKTPRVGIALGSNLGDRLANLQAAISLLREISENPEDVKCAPVYQTEPRLCPPGSPQFLNTVIEMDFAGTPLELLEITQTLEIQLGRQRSEERNAPRVIDIDLLYFGDAILDHPQLVLPHPRIAERRFVLQPLADLRPELILPGQERSVSEMLASLHELDPLERGIYSASSNSASFHARIAE